jgi:hypothetical protein
MALNGDRDHNLDFQTSILLNHQQQEMYSINNLPGYLEPNEDNKLNKASTKFKKTYVNGKRIITSKTFNDHFQLRKYFLLTLAYISKVWSDIFNDFDLPLLDEERLKQLPIPHQICFPIQYNNKEEKEHCYNYCKTIFSPFKFECTDLVVKRDDNVVKLFVLYSLLLRIFYYYSTSSHDNFTLNVKSNHQYMYFNVEYNSCYLEDMLASLRKTIFDDLMIKKYNRIDDIISPRNLEVISIDEIKFLGYLKNRSSNNSSDLIYLDDLLEAFPLIHIKSKKIIIKYMLKSKLEPIIEVENENEDIDFKNEDVEDEDEDVEDVEILNNYQPISNKDNLKNYLQKKSDTTDKFLLPFNIGFLARTIINSKKQDSLHDDKTFLHDDKTFLHDDKTFLHNDKTFLHNGKSNKDLLQYFTTPSDYVTSKLLIHNINKIINT